MFIYNPQNFSYSNLHNLLENGFTSLYINNKIVQYTLEDFLKMHLTFTDRESYLSWVKSWKEQYNALSNKTRINKKLNKKKYRESLTPEQYETLHNTEPKIPSWELYTKARFMLMLRAEAKVLSWQMKQTAKSA